MVWSQAQAADSHAWPGWPGLGSCDTRGSLPALQGCQMWIWRAWRCCCHPLHPSASWQAQGFEENHVADTEECFSTEFKSEGQLYPVFLGVSFTSWL